MEDFLCHLLQLHGYIHHCSLSLLFVLFLSIPSPEIPLSLSLSLFPLLSVAAPTLASYSYSVTASDLETARCWCQTWMTQWMKTGISPYRNHTIGQHLHCAYNLFFRSLAHLHTRRVITNVAPSHAAHNAALSTTLTRRKCDNLVLRWHTWVNWLLTLKTILLSDRGGLKPTQTRPCCSWIGNLPCASESAKLFRRNYDHRSPNQITKT